MLAVCHVDGPANQAQRLALRQEIRWLAPLASSWRDERLHLTFAIPADSADQAAWAIVARVREAIAERLLRVCARVAGDPDSEVVLTSVEDPDDEVGWPEGWPGPPADA